MGKSVSLKTSVFSPTSTPTRVKLNVFVDEKVYDLYAEQAISKGRTPEEEMASRLLQCATHTDQKFLYFNAEQSSELERKLAQNFQNPDQILQRLGGGLSVKSDGATVEVEPKVKKRLESRARSLKCSYEDYIKQVITLALEREVGLRP